MSHKNTANRSRDAHITLHQNRSQRISQTFQIEQQLRAVKAQIENAQARNTALSGWVVKWYKSIPPEAITEWNAILARFTV